MDPYCYFGSGVLRNKAGLHLGEQLRAHEARIVLKQLLQLYSTPSKADSTSLIFSVFTRRSSGGVLLGRHDAPWGTIAGFPKVLPRSSLGEQSHFPALELGRGRSSVWLGPGKVRGTYSVLSQPAERHSSLPRRQWANSAGVRPRTRHPRRPQTSLGCGDAVRDVQRVQALDGNRESRRSGLRPQESIGLEPLLIATSARSVTGARLHTRKYTQKTGFQRAV